MSDKNCISTFYFAEKYDCDELITNSRRFIHKNIVFVAKLDEFLHLEAEKIAKWISSDEITVSEEADVFKERLGLIKGSLSLVTVCFKPNSLNSLIKDSMLSHVSAQEL